MLFRGTRDAPIEDSALMTVTYVSQMVLFQPEIVQLKGQTDEYAIVITYTPPDGDVKRSRPFPLIPDTEDLEATQVALHRSPTKAFIMQNDINEWFSECFGWSTLLVYLGPYYRPVLGNLSPDAKLQQGSSWREAISKSISRLYYGNADEGLTFTDVAPYLIVTEESLQEVSSKLLDGQNMDITKFRPNIVLRGAASAYDEDYWAGLKCEDKDVATTGAVDFIITANCARCVSINIDYSTGEPGKGSDGTILKKMMKDRRIDPGAKYSPIFGRYAFLAEGSNGLDISIGNKITVSKRNMERTIFGKLTVANRDSTQLLTFD